MRTAPAAPLKGIGGDGPIDRGQYVLPTDLYAGWPVALVAGLPVAACGGDRKEMVGCGPARGFGFGRAEWAGFFISDKERADVS